MRLMREPQVVAPPGRRRRCASIGTEMTQPRHIAPASVRVGGSPKDMAARDSIREGVVDAGAAAAAGPPYAAATADILRLPAGRTEADRVAVEEPLEIRIGGRPIAVTMRTPGHDEELA